MSRPEGSGPDWNVVFDVAHRRAARRLLLLLGLGVAGALLLLSSGLTANGTITWSVLPAKSKSEKETTKKTKKQHSRRNKAAAVPPPRKVGQPATRDPRTIPAVPHQNKTGKKRKRDDDDRKCAAGGVDSADVQYEDCPPETPKPEEGEDDVGEESGDEPAADTEPKAAETAETAG